MTSVFSSILLRLIRISFWREKTRLSPIGTSKWRCLSSSALSFPSPYLVLPELFFRTKLRLFRNCIHHLSLRLSLFVHSFFTGRKGSCLNGSSLLSCLRERNQSVIHIDRQKGRLFSGSQVIRLARLPRFERPCAPIFDKKDPICYIIPRSVHRSDNQTNTL